MPEDAPQEKKEVEKIAKPRIPDPMFPPNVPPIGVHQVAEGIRCWINLPLPVCIEYDEVKKMQCMGRKALEGVLSSLLSNVILKPRKQKGVWSLHTKWPDNPTLTIEGVLDDAIAQIRSAIGEVK